jgi:Nuclease-related domain
VRLSLQGIDHRYPPYSHHCPHSRHPDFIIVHPANGLLVLEVKDWRLESIVLADKAKVELLTSRGIVRESSPLEQARKYMFEVVRTLERDGQLLFPAGHRFMGRPILPFGFGAVFTNITRKQFNQTNLKEVFAEHLCVFKDEMTEGANPEEFRSRLWRMVYPRLGEPLSMPQFDRLRALLFPEIRIRQIALPLDEAVRLQHQAVMFALKRRRRSSGPGARSMRCSSTMPNRLAS